LGLFASYFFIFYLSNLYFTYTVYIYTHILYVSSFISSSYFFIMRCCRTLKKLLWYQDLITSMRSIRPKLLSSLFSLMVPINNATTLFSKYHIFVLGSWFLWVCNILKIIVVYPSLFLSIGIFILFFVQFSSSLVRSDICWLFFDQLFFGFDKILLFCYIFFTFMHIHSKIEARDCKNWS